MTTGYKLPPQLDDEITQLEALIAKFRAGTLSAVELKAHRVPFGVYEQREADTYMVRIRCVAGIVTPGQLAKVAAIAARYGVGDLHLTSRQELQIHYVKLDDLVAVIRQLKEAGLSTRGGGGNTVRNIAAQDDAGIDPLEVFDVTPYAAALTTRLITENDSWNLPRKYKIAFSGSAHDKGQATLADLGFIARISEGKEGFRVYVAGGLGAKSAVGNLLFDFVDAAQVYPIAKAVKNLFWKYGNRKNKHAARLRFLWQSLGAEEFKRRFYEEFSKVTQEGYAPLVLEAPQAGSPVTAAVHPGLDEPEFVLWRARYVKEQKQGGLYSVLLPVELGFISCEGAGALARFLGGSGEDVVRVTRGQNFLLRNIPAGRLGEVHAFLAKVLPLVGQPALLGRILSCAGASTCQLGICLSRQAARALIQSLGTSGLDLDKAGEIRLNISGCPNACGHHPAADLGFAGKALRKDGHMYPGYSVYAGAVIHDGATKLAALAGDIPARAITLVVENLLAVFLAKADRFASFREYIAGEGKDDLAAIIARYKDIPSFDDDKNYYFDWSAAKVFSLAERGAGECSAGLFDLIEVDLGNIRRTQAKLSAAEAGQKGPLLQELVFFASRALLITRGVEPKSDKELYEAFRQHFIAAGHVDPAFEPVVTLAEHNDPDALVLHEKNAQAFVSAINALYDNMDNAFNFKRPAAAEASLPVPGGAPVPTVTKDLRGVVCPLNFVKTKVELAMLKTGDILEIWLDDGAPVENVPGSVRDEGHTIILQERQGDHWRVVIEKK